MRDPQMEDSQLSCRTCNVTATSPGQLAVHLGGKKHKRLTSNAGREIDAACLGNGNGELLNCELCNVEVASPLHQQYHLRGQKHQRKEKQNRLMNASEATAKESIGYLLSDDETDEAPGSPSSPEAAQQPAETSGNDLQGIPKQDAEEDKTTVQHVQPASLNTQQPGTGNSNERHALSALSSASSSLQMRLVSPFEEFPGPEDLPKQNNSGTSAENVTTDSQGGLRSEASAREAFHPQDAFCSHPESYYGPDMQALATGGSFSSPALYFCPACGIKATSQPNLEEHLQGRRHARRLQYLSRKALEQQNAQMNFHGPSGPAFAFGSLMLPTSMDFTSHLGHAARIPELQRRTSDRRSVSYLPVQTMHSQQYSFDSVRGLHSGRDGANNASTPETGSLRSAKKSAESNADSLRSAQKSGGSDAPVQSKEATSLQQFKAPKPASETGDRTSEPPLSSSPERREAGTSLPLQSEVFQPRQKVGDGDGPRNGLDSAINSTLSDPPHPPPTIPDPKATGQGADLTRSSSLSSLQRSSVRRSQGRLSNRQTPPRGPPMDASYAHLLPSHPYGPEWQGWNMYPMGPVQANSIAYAPMPYVMVPQQMAPGQGYPYFGQPPFLQGPAYPYQPAGHHQAPQQGWSPMMHARPLHGDPRPRFLEQQWGQAPRVGSDPNSPYMCQVCDVPLENLDALKHHVRGKQHLRKL